MAEIDKTKILKKCSRCGSTMLLEFFELNRKGEYYKTCTKCRTARSSKCEHARHKSSCKDCGGSSICEHNKIKYSCKECGGSQICVHNKYRSDCKDCGGGNICEHNKRRSQCKDCGGSSICEHNRQRNNCKECGGNGICEHNRIKSSCKDCGGSKICEHNRIKSQCKECCGSQICEHNRRRYVCKQCGGSGICDHDRIKSQCKDCGGSRICKHSKRKTECIICTPTRACQNCHSVYVHSRYRFHPYCFRCYCVLNPDVEIPNKYKLKEHYLRDALKEKFKEVELIFDKTCGPSTKRPDVLIDCKTHCVVIENDENQHKNGDYNCEDRRVMEIFQDLENRPLVIIRFNPDSYKKDGKKVSGCFETTKTGSLSINKNEWSQRVKLLIETIKKYLDHIPEKEVTVEYLYYDDGLS